jgi:hypothetical protein
MIVRDKNFRGHFEPDKCDMVYVQEILRNFFKYIREAIIPEETTLYSSVEEFVSNSVAGVPESRTNS